MKNRNVIIGLVALVVLTGIGYYLGKERGTTAGNGKASMVLYEMKNEKLAFSYPSNLFMWDTMKREGNAIKTVSLVENTEENRNLIAGKVTTPREGPTAITISVYENPKHLIPRTWIEEQDTWKLSDKKTEERVVGGANAYTYAWDGLYRGKTTVIGHGNFVYVISVTSMTPEDQLLRDYDMILNSAAFLP